MRPRCPVYGFYKKKQRFSSRLEAEVRWTRAVDRVLVLILEVFPSLTMLQWQSPKEIRSLTILNLVIGKDHRYLWSKHPLLSKNFSYTVLKLWQIYEGIEITMKYFVPHNSVQQVCIFITSNKHRIEKIFLKAVTHLRKFLVSTVFHIFMMWWLILTEGIVNQFVLSSSIHNINFILLCIHNLNR